MNKVVSSSTSNGNSSSSNVGSLKSGKGAASQGACSPSESKPCSYATASTGIRVFSGGVGGTPMSMGHNGDVNDGA
jgi:hypothetical protein